MGGVIVCSSGGVDSGVLLRRAPAGSVALFFNYGQPALLQEWRAMCAQVKALGLTRSERHLDLWAGPMQAPVGKPGPRIVPARNTVFVAHAANEAAERGLAEVWFGATAADQALYPDCRPEWAAAISEALGVPVRLPLVGMSRAEVRAELGDLPAWSCYNPMFSEPCGTCDSCRQDAGGATRS